MNENAAYKEKTFDNWEELFQYFLKPHYTFFFRGVESYEFELATKLQRIFESNKIDKAQYLIREKDCIDSFKRMCYGLLSKVPDENNILGWLSLMQHYGAPTRLLDWSLSPFVGCYFAYRNFSEDDAALWQVNPDVLFVTDVPYDFHFNRNIDILRTKEVLKEKAVYQGYSLTEKIAFINNLINSYMSQAQPIHFPFQPIEPDMRMLSQRSVFTIQGDLSLHLSQNATQQTHNIKFFNDMAETTGSLENPNVVSFTKIRLKKEWRIKVLKALENMNITEATLFPGLDGIGKATEIGLQTSVYLRNMR